jgi:YD repeat-containing protein
LAAGVYLNEPSLLRASVGRQTQVQDALGNLTTTVYDGAGNVTSKLDALGNRTTYTFDTNNRQTSVKDALGNLATTVYDAAGNVSAQVATNSCTDWDEQSGKSIVRGTLIRSSPPGHRL